ncbi:MAG: antibiotic biosynthesis monooxygenase [Saprospiraceae bacterium]|nr:antibiotic biosynthesis monooxygenase [Saprospiraceae bacterium]
MLVLTVTLHIRPEKAEQAKPVLRSLVAAARQMEGVQAFNMGEDLQAPGVFHISEVYDSYEVKSAVESSEAFQTVIRSIGSFFISPPKTVVYEAVAAE